MPAILAVAGMVARYGRGMDHIWAASQLRTFVLKIDQLAELDAKI